jgi:hypothetical protein
MNTKLSLRVGKRSQQVLWRMRGPVRVVAASLRRTLIGFELRVAYEPHGVGEVLLRDTAAGLFASRRLQQRARRVRDALASQGWTLLEPRSPVTRASRYRYHWSKLSLISAAVGVIGTAGWMRRRRNQGNRDI